MTDEAKRDQIAKETVQKIYTAIAQEQFPLDTIIRAALDEALALPVTEEMILAGRRVLFEDHKMPFTQLAPKIFNAMRSAQIKGEG
jgi:hypothetical protein